MRAYFLWKKILHNLTIYNSSRFIFCCLESQIINFWNKKFEQIKLFDIIFNVFKNWTRSSSSCEELSSRGKKLSFIKILIIYRKLVFIYIKKCSVRNKSFLANNFYTMTFFNTTIILSLLNGIINNNIANSESIHLLKKVDLKFYTNQYKFYTFSHSPILNKVNKMWIY